MKRSKNRSLKFLALPMAACLFLGGCFGVGGKKKPVPAAGTQAEPDKVLYERAMNDIKHGRHTVGRLTLQTLLNTYPDSDYLAKAKLAMADSFYKEGGTSGLTQAIAEYKDFKTFFPFLPEAAYAQLQVGLCHYRRMEKPDRDRTQAKLAEDEFQAFLLEYPKDKMAPQAEQRLREVQEVLAEGDYRIGHYYYVKGSKRAAYGRLTDLANRYPLYSRADEANWMIGNIWEKSERKDLAAVYYAKIVREYPLSPLASHAKSRLTELGAKVPEADPVALARMQKEREIQRTHPGMFHKATGMIRSSPDVRSAARSGAPNMTPSGEASPGTETLTPGGTSTVGGSGRGAGNSAIVQVVPTGGAGGGSSATDAPKESGTTSPPANSDPNASSNPPATGDASKPSTTGGSDPKAGANANGAQSSSSDTSKKDPGADKSKESTSKKKKKKLLKIIPL